MTKKECIETLACILVSRRKLGDLNKRARRYGMTRQNLYHHANKLIAKSEVER